MKKTIKIIVALILISGVVFSTAFLLNKVRNKKTEKKYSVVSTSFPGYDFARAVAGENTDISVKMLLKPGAESHSFEPTPQDILAIKESDLFIYVGGDSDEWVKKMISEIDPKKTKIMKLVDLVKVKNEEVVEGMEDDHDDHDDKHEHKHSHEHDEHDDKDEHRDNDHEKDVEIDEHVWTSPKNAKEIVNKILAEISKIDKNEENKLKQNAKEYSDKLDEIDGKIRAMVKVAKRKEIIVGDRFPFRYFVDEYGLKYYAAFPGCSEQTEANAKTISFIVKKVKEDKIPVVLKIELSNGLVAETVAKETGAKVEEFQSAHNISEKDFEAGVTYVDLMKRNLEVLTKALND